MKRLFLALLLLACPLFAGYSKIRQGTIDHTQAGASNSTNFSVLVNITATDLKTVGNGGSVTNASGFDIVVTSDAACSTVLPFERVLYVATTGQLVMFFQQATLSHTVDGTVYLCDGNAAITTDQSNKTGTWDSNYGGVYHFQESAHPYNDSTTNAKNSTSGTDPSQVTGLFGNAQSFVAASDQQINFSSSPLPGSEGSDLWTISAWVKKPNSTGNTVIFESRTSGSPGGPIFYIAGSTGFATGFFGPSGPSVTGSTNLEDNAWHYLVLTGVELYVDGSPIASWTINQSSSGTAIIGNSYATDWTTFTMQEAHVSSIARSADWVTAEYNNQKSGSTFLTFAAPVTPATGGGFPIVM
jgi:hypothetical protein